MKKFKVLLLLAMSAVLLAACSTSAPVENYVSEDGKFSVAFPGTPEVTNESVPTAAGNIELYNFLYEQSATMAYMVSYSDFPSDLVAQSNVTDLLAGSKEGQLGTLSGAVTDEEKEVKVGENPGIWFKAHDASLYVVAKNFMVGNRLYQVVMMRDGSYPSDEDQAAFFDSFELK